MGWLADIVGFFRRNTGSDTAALVKAINSEIWNIKEEYRTQAKEQKTASNEQSKQLQEQNERINKLQEYVGQLQMLEEECLARQIKLLEQFRNVKEELIFIKKMKKQ